MECQTDRAWIESLCKDIGLPGPETRAALTCWDSHADDVTAVAHACYQSGNVRILKKEVKRDAAYGGAFSLCVTLAMARQTLAEYQRRGIPAAIFRDTMTDIVLWCENFKRESGAVGLNETNWLINHIQLILFRLGRLQFQRAAADLPAPRGVRRNLPIRQGESCLNVHIPQGCPLSPDSCLDSFAQAARFMADFFPGESYRYYTCYSWLLWPDNRTLLASTSNIVQFLDFWQIVYARPDDRQAIERIWGERRRDIHSYPEETSLQRAAKAHLLAGGKLGEGYGIRRL